MPIVQFQSSTRGMQPAHAQLYKVVDGVEKVNIAYIAGGNRWVPLAELQLCNRNAIRVVLEEKSECREP